jgi:hypothetical protein
MRGTRKSWTSELTGGPAYILEKVDLDVGEQVLESLEIHWLRKMMVESAGF